MNEIRLQEIAARIFERCQNIKLFYPLNQSEIWIEESDKTANNDLKGVHIQNLPPNCWVFEHEFYQSPLSVNIEQRGSFSNGGNRVEKSILWQKDDLLYLLMLEMKTAIVPKKAKEYVEKIEHSLNSLSLHLAVHQYFSQLENCTLFPIGVICYNNDNECISSYFEDKSPKFLDSDAIKTFKIQYIEAGKRAFKMKIHSVALGYSPKIPLLFLKNNTGNPNRFSLDFEEVLGIMEEV